MDGSSSRSRSDHRTATGTYALSCNDCPFDTTVSGGLAAVYAVLDDHERRRADGSRDHFVTCRRVDDDRSGDTGAGRSGDTGAGRFGDTGDDRGTSRR